MMDWQIYNLIVSVSLVAMGAVCFLVGFCFGFWVRERTLS